MSFLSKIFGDANEKFLKSVQPTVEKINSLEPDFLKLSDVELKEKTNGFKERLAKGETLDDILPEAFALVREVSKRNLKQRHYDVQLIGGITLHQGKITEMKTGEGKTLVATLPLYLNALEGKGCHLVTINDYLARRDTVWMGQIYHALGLTTGCVNHDQSFLYDPSYKKPDLSEDETRDKLGSFLVVEDFLRPCSRKEAYAADITYGTNNEYGFDYLKDNMVYDLNQQVQRGFNFAIVDEVDSILIDEARTPLIISAPDVESSKWYQDFARIIPRLDPKTDYEIDEKLRAVTLTESGINRVEQILGATNIYEEKGIKYLHHLEQALRAEALFKKDRDYVVKNGEIIIVDEFTGRLMPGRRWSGGLHQAVEAKERVNVREESMTLASITFQNYFRMYKKLGGMTGTAATSAEEFFKVYNLDTVMVPTNKPLIRKDLPDRIYKTETGKYKALVKENQGKARNRPSRFWWATKSVEKNELYSEKMLDIEGIPHQILNAKFHEKEER
jgi:preprotein translocase subunit SecA